MKVKKVQNDIRPTMFHVLSKVLTDAELAAAKAAINIEHRKWVGHPDWEKPIAEIFAAALQAIADERAGT